MLSGLRILVIDESGDWRELIEEALAAESAVVRQAASGSQALAMYVEFAPHVLVADLLLPRLNGHAFLQYLRAMVHIPSERTTVPAIAVTGLTEPTLDQLAAAFGYGALLRKPFPPQDLVTAILKLTGRVRNA